jgi:hypothetical protein
MTDIKADFKTHSGEDITCGHKWTEYFEIMSYERLPDSVTYDPKQHSIFCSRG